MRRSLVLAATCAIVSVQVASAADMPTKAPAYAPVAPMVYNWTGLYVGGHIGGGWFSTQATHVAATASFPAGFVDNTIDGSGFLGGGYAGFNYQINQFVIGLDGDYSWANLKGSGSDISPINGGTANHEDKVKWIATVTGRLGYAMNDWLLFGKGGWAWAGFEGNTTGVSAAGVTVNTASSSETRNGWTVGGGVEWSFLPQWSAKLEYDYVKFNTSDFNATITTIPGGVVTVSPRSATSNLSMVKLGVSYRFWAGR